MSFSYLRLLLLLPCKPLFCISTTFSHHLSLSLSFPTSSKFSCAHPALPSVLHYNQNTNFTKYTIWYPPSSDILHLETEVQAGIQQGLYPLLPLSVLLLCYFQLWLYHTAVGCAVPAARRALLMNLSSLPTQLMSQLLVKSLQGNIGYFPHPGTCHSLRRLSSLCQSPHWTELLPGENYVKFWL